MPSNFVQQIDRIVSKLSNANDPLPGQSVSSGTGAVQYGGQVGARVCLGNDDIAIVNSSSPTLYGGIYQYVQFFLTATKASVAGLLAFWQTDSTYIVTNDEPTGCSDIAGICLNAVSKGNYGWIQIAGKATVQYRAVLTKTTPAVGDLVIAAALGSVTPGVVDIIADATNITSVQLRSAIGIVVGTAPAFPGGGLGTVRLRFTSYNF
jgi:hypothetical protein